MTPAQASQLIETLGWIAESLERIADTLAKDEDA